MQRYFRILVMENDNEWKVSLYQNDGSSPHYTAHFVTAQVHTGEVYEPLNAICERLQELTKPKVDDDTPEQLELPFPPTDSDTSES